MRQTEAHTQEQAEHMDCKGQTEATLITHTVAHWSYGEVDVVNGELAGVRALHTCPLMSEKFGLDSPFVPQETSQAWFSYYNKGRQALIKKEA